MFSLAHLVGLWDGSIYMVDKARVLDGILIIILPVVAHKLLKE